MKKIISIALVVLTLVLGMVGCSNEAVQISEEEQAYLATYMQKTVQTLSALTEENFEELRSLPELETDLTLRQGFGIPIEAEEFLDIMDVWESAEQECGELLALDIDTLTFVQNSDGVAVVIKGDFQIRDATITVQFDKNQYIKTMNVSGVYSKGEIFKKAGLNTILGMGVVFAVLIFLAFVIGLLKYVPTILEKFQRKENVEPIEDDEEDAGLECNDDLELVAVITAAIAAKEGTSSNGFVVRSIKRRKTNHWK